MQLTTFFKLVFTTDREGIVCIASKPAQRTEGWKESYFNWPSQAPDMEDFVHNKTLTHDLWFCPQLLATRKRDRSAVKYAPTIWADLDECDASNLLIEPTLVIQSSPDRYQAYWLLEDDYVLPADAEDVARRIAYYHKHQGCDVSGWDLSQLLRVFGSKNFKYKPAPEVMLTAFKNESIPLSDFLAVYPEVPGASSIMELPKPTELEDGLDVLMRNRSTLNPIASILFGKDSQKGERSTDLWKLECLLFEGGLTPNEVYFVAREAQCNKYEEDGRSDDLMWRDVLRAKQYLELQAQERTNAAKLEIIEPLLTDQQRYEIVNDRTLIEDYVDWASGVTDASKQYHIGCAFMILSSLLAGKVSLATQFGKVTPNLWFMILADTTLTRKTTSMQLAMDLLGEIDEDALLATDGSIEGLLTAMATRPGKTSVFHRDEFAGLLKSMVTKEYLAGMPEAFTQMYDGKRMKRILRKETIDVRNPVFILFTGGIKTSILELLNRDQVQSGFVPRFIFITAEADMTTLRPLGPPTLMSVSGRMEIKKKLAVIYNHYANATETITINGKNPKVLPKHWEAELTIGAWAAYNEFAAILQKQAASHEEKAIIMPCMTRLAGSGLKASVLIAASRKNHQGKVEVTEQDVIHAFYYVEHWREYLLEVLDSVDKTPFEKLIAAISTTAKDEPGIPRGTIMRRFKLNSRQADEAINTAEQRMLITTQRGGKTTTLWPYGFEGKL